MFVGVCVFALEAERLSLPAYVHNAGLRSIIIEHDALLAHGRHLQVVIDTKMKCFCDLTEPF